MAIKRRRLVDDFWNLRDDAFDHPERWQGVGVDTVFQRLAELVEAAEERQDPIDWAWVCQQMLEWPTVRESG